MIISNQYKQNEILKIDSQSSSNSNCESRLNILKNDTKNGTSENQSGAGRKSEKFSGALSDISKRSRVGDGKKKGRKRSKRDDDSDDEGEDEGGRGGEGEGECSGERREDREREGEREGGSESGYEKGHRHRIERRDVAFSSMHCVAKLSKAKLGNRAMHLNTFNIVLVAILLLIPIKRVEKLKNNLENSENPLDSQFHKIQLTLISAFPPFSCF